MRRTILERLVAGPMSVGELAAELPISRPAVSQHLRVLRDAGLVRARAAGTRRLYGIDPSGIGAVREYWERLWSRALERFRAAAEKSVEAGNGQGG